MLVHQDDAGQPLLVGIAAQVVGVQRSLAGQGNLVLEMCIRDRSSTVASVVMRVTRDAEEKWSRLAKSNFCTAAYSARRSSDRRCS